MLFHSKKIFLSLLALTFFSANAHALSFKPCPQEGYAECIKAQEEATKQWNEMNERLNNQHHLKPIDHPSSSVSAPSALLALLAAYGLYRGRRKMHHDTKK